MELRDGTIAFDLLILWDINHKTGERKKKIVTVFVIFKSVQLKTTSTQVSVFGSEVGTYF